MPNYIDFPPELESLRGKVYFLQQINDNEYHSSCPNCGVDDTKHSDSKPSNRFVIWLESRSNGKPFGMCVRHCGYKWTPEKSDAVWTEEEKKAFEAKKRELNERENQRISEYARNVIMKQHIYISYLENMKKSEYGKMYLDKRGFKSEEWNRFFGFGIFDAYKCTGKFSTYYSPAITMPIRGLNEDVENIKLRVTEAKHSDDRFRNLYKLGNQSIYLPMNEGKIQNKIILVEGEMKAAYVAMFSEGGKMGLPQIVGTQGKGVGSRMLYAIEKCEVVYIALDPDTFIPKEKGESTIMQVSKKIGYDRVRIILSGKQKIDDAVRRGLNLVNSFNMAVKPQSLGLKIL